MIMDAVGADIGSQSSHSRFRLWDRNAARSHMPVDGRDVLIKLVDSVFFVP
jgi:hypothetical protein